MKSTLILFSFLFLSQLALAHEAKVLSWNVFMLPKPLKYSWQKFRTHLIGEELKKNDYDIIFMQEAFTKSFRNSIRSAIGETYPHQYTLGKRAFYYPMNSGVFVLSKYPFTVLDRVYYKACGTADCFASKGSVLIEVTFPDGKIAQFASTHLQSKRELGHKRESQVAQVSAMLKKHERPGVPQFLTGDLNIDFETPEFQDRLQDAGMDFAQLTGPILYTNKLKNPCYKTSGDGINHQWIDHFWVKNFNPANVLFQVKDMKFLYEGASCPLSDHHAVEASFKL